MTTPVIEEVCIGFWNCVSPDAFVTGIGTLTGAFLGALIAGLITYTLLKHQLNYDRAKERYRELSSHLKISSNILSRINVVIVNANQYLEKTSDSNNDSEVVIKNLEDLTKSYIDLFKKTSHEINEYDINQLAYDKFLNYIGSIELIKILILELENMVKNISTEQKYQSHLIEFRSKLKTLEGGYTTISKQREEFEEEIKKLNKKLQY